MATTGSGLDAVSQLFDRWQAAVKDVDYYSNEITKTNANIAHLQASIQVAQAGNNLASAAAYQLQIDGEQKPYLAQMQSALTAAQTKAAAAKQDWLDAKNSLSSAEQAQADAAAKAATDAQIAQNNATTAAANKLAQDTAAAPNYASSMTTYLIIGTVVVVIIVIVWFKFRKKKA